MMLGEDLGARQDAHYRHRSGEPKPCVISRYQLCNVRGVVENRKQITVEVRRPIGDRLFVCVANNLDHVDIEFLDVIENVARGPIDERVMETRASSSHHATKNGLLRHRAVSRQIRVSVGCAMVGQLPHRIRGMQSWPTSTCRPVSRT
jgi:hypothetical protein